MWQTTNLSQNWHIFSDSVEILNNVYYNCYPNSAPEKTMSSFILFHGSVSIISRKRWKIKQVGTWDIIVSHSRSTVIFVCTTFLICRAFAEQTGCACVPYHKLFVESETMKTKRQQKVMPTLFACWSWKYAKTLNRKYSYYVCKICF